MQSAGGQTGPASHPPDILIIYAYNASLFNNSRNGITGICDSKAGDRQKQRHDAIAMTISDLHGESQCVIDHFGQADGFRNGFAIHSNLIISKIAGRIHFCTLMDVDAIEQLPRRSITKRTAVLEHI